MNKLRIYYRSIVFLFIISTGASCATSDAPPIKGIVRASVAHLVGQPLGNDAAYHTLPACGAKHNMYLSCPRMHQLLAHEEVTILKANEDEYLIDVPHTFYVTENTKVPQTRYWTSKKNIVTHDELTRNNVDLNLLPQPISFQNSTTLTQHPQIATLLKPYADRTVQQTYSAGTRFVIKEITKDKKYIWVHAVNPHTNSLAELRIPQAYIIKTPTDSIKQKIQTFVDILKIWAHQEDGHIPYIWGGCSFVHLESSHTFLENVQERNGIMHSWYTRAEPHAQNAQLNSGFDCAGLINRAAQMAGIPFFYKNTRTIAEHMQEIEPNERLHPGDIIWIRGHVMVVANTRTNTIIEARGYDSDFGRVHEIELCKVFEGIKTFSDLKRAWLEKRPLNRLNRAGKVQDVVKQMKLLKMKSVFKT